jgi:hypothetical protein
MPITCDHAGAQRRRPGTSSTGTFVASSMSAATDSITISITTGIARALFWPGSVRSAGKNPKTTTSATPARKMRADAFAAGASGCRSCGASAGGTLPAPQARLVLGIVGEILADEHRDDRRRDDAQERGRHADHQDLRQAPLRGALLGEEADHRGGRRGDGLAVIACCEAIVATAIGRSGRMPLWCAVS